MKLIKTKLATGVATAAVAMVGAVAAPQAIAHTKAERVAEAASKKVEAMEAQMSQMSNMMQAMQAELARVKAQAGAPNQKVQELEDWVEAQKNAPPPSKDHVFAVRGGWMHFNDNRGSTRDQFGAGTGVGNDILTSEVDKDAFYIGGAIDFNMNNDLFGLMDDTSFGIELGIEYAEIGDREESGLTRAITTLDSVTVGGSPVAADNYQQSVTVNQLRISASPKIKFLHGSKFRPWLIPVGLDLNIISPPSDAVTVLNTGMQFGVGADYEVFPGIVIGADGRYHHSLDDIDGVDTDGFTLGGSVGFKF
ncbi:MAG: hypothetical protein ACU833_11880 [Gammaproteobacteria bacterium]